MKQIQIPASLFYDLVLYHLCDMTEPEERIHKALNDKMEAVLRRECYTQYKTAPDETKREEARKAYLESAGFFPVFAGNPPSLLHTGACHAPVTGGEGKHFEMSAVPTKVFSRAQVSRYRPTK